jgi:hypothetical protein
MSLAEPRVARSRTLTSENSGDGVWIATRIAPTADAQAARLRRQAIASTATICAAAEREAEMVRQQASGQAAAIREAAEREAAELRAAVMKLAAGPGELLYVDGDVASPKTAGLAGQPSTGPKAAPGTRLARRPQGPPRQLVAMRVAAAATATLAVFAVTAGTTEVALHGFKFFVFRSAGTGETGGTETDQQFLAKEHTAAKAVAAKAVAQRSARERVGPRRAHRDKG